MKELTFSEHLDELRQRLVRSLIALGVGTVIAIWQRRFFLEIVDRPHDWVMQQLNLEKTLYVFRYQETFLSQLKVCLISGFLLVSPYILFQAWRFFGEALKTDEKKAFWQFFPVCFSLFAIGASFGYFLLIPYGLLFLAQFGLDVGLSPMINFGNYVSFFFLMTIVVGLVFELPLIMTMMVVLGATTEQKLRQMRKVAILGIFVCGALLTPPDPATQLMMAAPLVLLYEIGCLSARIAQKRRERRSLLTKS